MTPTLPLAPISAFVSAAAVIVAVARAPAPPASPTEATVVVEVALFCPMAVTVRLLAWTDPLTSAWTAPPMEAVGNMTESEMAPPAPPLAAAVAMLWPVAVTVTAPPAVRAPVVWAVTSAPALMRASEELPFPPKRPIVMASDVAVAVLEPVAATVMLLAPVTLPPAEASTAPWIVAVGIVTPMLRPKDAEPASEEAVATFGPLAEMRTAPVTVTGPPVVAAVTSAFDPTAAREAAAARAAKPDRLAAIVDAVAVSV